MSRSGYVYDDCDQWATIKWRGQVASATRGKRGQQMLKDLLVALDALDVKRLTRNELATPYGVCALGALGMHKGLEMADVDPEDTQAVGELFNISPALAAEVVYLNDEWRWVGGGPETPEHRWQRMRDWVVSQIRDPAP